MKTRTKSTLSIALALMLGFSLHSPTPTDADAVTDATTIQKGTLSIQYMGKGEITADDPKDESAGAANFNTNNQPGEDPFWIGVAVEGVNHLDIFKKGVYSLELAFEYNPAYVMPYYTDEKDWQTFLEEANHSADATGSDKLFWNGTKYDIIAVKETDLDTTSDRANGGTVLATRQDEDWKMCTVCITYVAESWDDARFVSMSDTGTNYLLRLPFRLVKLPSEGTNPTVLSLVRGSETFDIGSGPGGTGADSTTGTYAAWEEAAAAADPSDMHNLKNLLTFTGDIKLFGEGSSIEDIQYLTAADGTPEELYQEDTLTNTGFVEEIFDYYISVPNATASIYLRIEAAVEPIVTDSSGTKQTVTALDEGIYITAALPLVEMDKTKGNNGFDNEYTVSDGKVSYTVHIRRLLKPEIKLNPGNSPYGEIQRMHVDYLGEEKGWSTEKVQDAKDAFDVGNKYNPNYLPTDCNSSIVYQPFAWNDDVKSAEVQTDRNINFDRNEEALFVYQGKEFVDPGFEARDAYGEIVDASKVTKSMEVLEMQSHGTANIATSKLRKRVVSDSGGADYSFADLKDKYIRPGAYELKYSFVDTTTNETAVATRNVIMLWIVGDANLSTVRNPTDASYVTQIVKEVVTPLDDVPGKAACLYYYRIVDINRSGVVNPTDSSYVTQTIKGSVDEYTFYNDITPTG